MLTETSTAWAEDIYFTVSVFINAITRGELAQYWVNAVAAEFT